MTAERRRVHLLLYLLLAGTLAGALYLTLRGFDLVGAPGAAQVRDVPPGDQEVAFLVPATASDTWERLVSAADALRRDWPKVYPGAPSLHVCKDKAFVELTADVAELALSLGGADRPKLWIRWYKLTSENSAGRWIEKLAARRPPPLAIIGGDISDRALIQAQALKVHRGQWQGADPVYLLTTATADRYNPGSSTNRDHTDEKLPKLIDLYDGRSFRFSFTNKHMARVVLEFVSAHPAIWPHGQQHAAARAGAALTGDALASLTLLAAVETPRRHALHWLAWRDDSYSLDLAARFGRVMPDVFPHSYVHENWIAYSTGDYYRPNPREVLAVAILMNQINFSQADRQLLVLPTAAQRAQRFLRALVRRDPLRTRRLVVVTGDSISFNSIYRDRNVIWNIHDMPVPLVLFAHRNPVSATAGFLAGKGGAVTRMCTATDDLLLHRDVLEALVQAAYRDGPLLADVEELRARLAGAQWWKGRVVIPGFPGAPSDGSPRPLFGADGDRNPSTGEHVVWLRPDAPPEESWAEATITVWRRQPVGAAGNGWLQAGPPLYVNYDAASAHPPGD
ncbi:MAG: hypothetical protein IT429_18475 [Gemmataceae bacterium]|nr:hypothetical protein [Gemmataceae bacterium]